MIYKDISAYSNYLSYCWAFQGFITFMMPGEMSYLTYWCLKSDFSYNILNFPSINKIVAQGSRNNWKHILPFLVSRQILYS